MSINSSNIVLVFTGGLNRYGLGEGGGVYFNRNFSTCRTGGELFSLFALNTFTDFSNQVTAMGFRT